MITSLKSDGNDTARHHFLGSSAYDERTARSVWKLRPNHRAVFDLAAVIPASFIDLSFNNVR